MATSTTSQETTSRDRAIGALVGLAVGDAVGATLEFRQPGTFRPLEDMVGGGPHDLVPGQWTDDTSMAMCLAESILDTGGMDPKDQLRRYVEWRNNGYWSSKGHCFDIGHTTSSALSRFERTGEVIDAVIDEDKAANGSLMRLAPVPIRWHHELDQAIELAALSSTTTHAARRPVDACRLYGAMIAAIIRGDDQDTVLSNHFWQFGSLTPEIEQLARGSWKRREPPEIRGDGYVVNSLEASLWAVSGADSFREAVLRAANLGDDADTTAAITGQLAGARWGVNSIPTDWLDLLVERERIITIAGRLHDEATGSPPPDPWGHDDLHHAYWVRPGQILAGEYPARKHDPEITRRKLDLLVDNGIRTFVDLTHPADHMDPYRDILSSIATDRGLDLDHVQMPIPDMGVVDEQRYDEIVTTITRATRRGGVYFHCWGGIGRTGTVAGCLLVDSGLDGRSALARLDELRSVTRKRHMEAPQTRQQVDIIMKRGRSA